MDFFPGRVPFSKEETYTPLRAPKTNQQPVQSNLSVNAKVFVPRVNTAEQQLEQQQQHQQQQLLEQQQQQHQHDYYARSQRQQRYNNPPNGFQHHQPQHHHMHYQQQQQQQHNQQLYQMEQIRTGVQDRLGLNGPSGATSKSSMDTFYPQNQHQRQNREAENLHHHYHHHQQQQHHNQHQQRFRQQTPYASSHNNKKNTNNAAANAAPDAAEMESIALDYLSTAIQCLNRNPGQFDTVANRFLSIFDGMEHNQYVLSIAMEDIFKESIQNTNFRYMGAKLYNLLHMLNLKKDSLFNTLLKCKLDYHQDEVHEYMQQNNHGKVRETALFLAELYMQLRGDDSRIILLAENIVFSLIQLLSCESADNIRCICLTLKLAGYDLSSDCPKEVNGIIDALAEIETNTPGKYPIVASVLALQKDNWGRKLASSTSLSESEGLPEPPRTSDEPIFYGPDGRELTAEETDFLARDPCGSADEDDEAPDFDADDLDPEMNEEEERAYKEFCKLNSSS